MIGVTTTSSFRSLRRALISDLLCNRTVSGAFTWFFVHYDSSYPTDQGISVRVLPAEKNVHSNTNSESGEMAPAICLD